jgi:MFS superfamily sulfate permease-like transporter
MHKMFKWFFVVVLTIVTSMQSFAQHSTDTLTVNDTMRSHNKIYVVMAVCLTILAGLILYVVNVDRRVRKMEKGNEYN